MRHPTGWTTQIASNIELDGLAMELLNDSKTVLAEVFRWDTDNVVRVTCWSSGVTAEILGWFLPYAHTELSPFEDGSPLPPVSTWEVTRPS